MLNLWNLKQVSVREKADEYHIVATAVTPTPICQCCGIMLRNGTKSAEFVDTPMHGKRVVIEVRMQRYKCKGCGATHYPEIPNMHERHRMTQRCFDYITKNGTKRSWSALGAEIGIDAQTVSDIWNAWADGVLSKLRPTTPEWLGIDELFIMRKYRAVITDVRNRALVTMLPGRDLGTLHAYFTERIDCAKVQVVTMDMWEPYRTTVKACFPNAKIVVDRFHVMKYASEAVAERTEKNGGAAAAGAGAHDDTSDLAATLLKATLLKYSSTASRVGTLATSLRSRRISKWSAECPPFIRVTQCAYPTPR